MMRITWIFLALLLLLSVDARAADEVIQLFLRNYKCDACHDLSAKVVGPSYADIAGNFTSDGIERLTNTIRNGRGRYMQWGAVPMPSMRSVSRAQARCIALWIVGLKFDKNTIDDSCMTLLQQTPHGTQAFAERFIEPEMVVIPAGTVMMGSPSDEAGRDKDEGPVHLVTIKKAFEVSKYEVTFDEWDHCVDDGGCEIDVLNGFGNDFGLGRGKQPLIGVNWQNAHSYIKWLNKVTGKNYRLLTEAEWEYAARAGTKTEYYWGSEIGRNNANCRDCGNESGGKHPMPVGSFKPNAFGLYDMLGNVREWTEDAYQNNYIHVPVDGSAYVANIDTQVMRGGSWNALGSDIRSAFRDHNYQNIIGDDKTGFRLARSLP